MPKPCFGCDRAEFLQGAGTGRRSARLRRPPAAGAAASLRNRPSDGFLRPEPAPCEGSVKELLTHGLENALFPPGDLHLRHP